MIWLGVVKAYITDQEFIQERGECLAVSVGAVVRTELDQFEFLNQDLEWFFAGDIRGDIAQGFLLVVRYVCLSHSTCLDIPENRVT